MIMTVEEAFKKWKAKPENVDTPDDMFPLDYMYNHEYGTAPDPAKMVRIIPFGKEPETPIDTGIVLEVGKTYLNTLGEKRTIVATYSDDPYVFVDQFDWSYTKDGIYDLPDFWAGADIYALIEEVK